MDNIDINLKYIIEKNKELDNEINSIYQGSSDTNIATENSPLRYIEKLGVNVADVDTKSILKDLDIKIIEDSWSKTDFTVTFIAGVLGSIADILITQTDLLKGFDKVIKEALSGSKFQTASDNISKFFRNGDAAPIDYQDFSMHGLKSLHEQYSFGHDPIRILSGILQMITGKYNGVDSAGKLISENFGTGVSNPLYATISYITHMLADFCNKNSLPYPGSTFLMQFGSEETREAVAAAYRGQLFNARTFVYQAIPTIFIGLVIKSYLIYQNWIKTKKISFSVLKTKKANEMLLAANAIVAVQNVAITSTRVFFGEAHAMFRYNWPQILNTTRLAVKYLIRDYKETQLLLEKVDDLHEEVMQRKPKQKKSVDDYLSSLKDEFSDWEKNN